MTFRRFFVLLIAPLALAVAAVLASPQVALSETLAKPAGDVVLTVDGQIGKENVPGQADFDIDMIRAMPTVKFLTSTPWTDQPVEFEGVLIETILKFVDAKGKTIKATALNDYIADVDVETAVSAGAMVAFRMNGAEIAVRDKGPLWIMFPFDQKPELKAEPIYSQSVWQLWKLTFVD
jgi:hypothetical protein